MICKLVVCVSLIVVCLADLPDWDHFSAKFPAFTKLPMTETEAKQQGWKMVNNACKANKNYVGRQYSKKASDKTRMLLFDVHGSIAGIQMAFPNSLNVAKNQIGGPIAQDGTDYIITAYFTDPKSICDTKSVKRREKFVGENLYLLKSSKEVMLVPLKQSHMAGTKWVKGKCFLGMGQHYWYDISNDMSCDDFFPFFVLYNGGNLNGFGFATGSNIGSSNVEHPPKSLLGLFFDKATKPACLSKEKHLSTQHVYLQRRPYFNLC